MAGVRYSVRINSDTITERLNELIKKGSDLTVPFRQIGEELLISHHLRFEKQISPDGIPWAPLRPVTQSLKPKNKDTILLLNDILRSTLNYQVGPEQFEFGSPLVYAAIHQFGGKTASTSMIPNKEIAARPFLGLDGDDTNYVVHILSEFLMR